MKLAPLEIGILVHRVVHRVVHKSPMVETTMSKLRNATLKQYTALDWSQVSGGAIAYFVSNEVMTPSEWSCQVFSVLTLLQ